MTDHRIGLTLYKLEEILGGSLDEVIDSLVAADRAAQLEPPSRIRRDCYGNLASQRPLPR